MVVEESEPETSVNTVGVQNGVANPKSAGYSGGSSVWFVYTEM